MGNRIRIVAATMALLAPGSADAQGFIITPYNIEPPKECFDPNLAQDQAMVEDRRSRANAAIRDYLALAARSTDLRSAFTDKKHSLWLLDGVEKPLASVSDPWAAKVVKIEPMGFAVSNLDPYHYRGAWRASAADGTTLGYYDGHFQRSAKGRGSIFVLKLVSSAAEPPKVTRYCRFPRDIEDPSLRRVPGEARRH